MGTSTNYKAPTSQQWSDLKRKVTRLMCQGRPSSSDIKRILQDFVSVNYGTSQGTGRGGGTGGGRVAQGVTQNIGGFFSSVADVGFREAFELAGLGSLEGKSVREIGHSLLDCLGGSSNTIDEVDARKALSNLIDEILKDTDSLEEVEEAMEAISHGESLNNLIQRFLGYLIYEQFCRNHYGQLVARIGEVQADERIDGIKVCIFDVLSHLTRDQDISRIDWNGTQGQQIIDKILQDTWKAFSI